jgi:predicted Zn-dependent peptidase
VFGLLVVAAPGAALEVDSFTLDNGMTFLVVEREGPLVAAGWSVRWGSGDDAPGRTGAAHFLEHLLFQGTEAIGTRDWARESALRSERDALLEEQAGARPIKPKRRTEIDTRLAQIEAELRQVSIPGDFARVYAEAGALGVDAVTNRDLSVYSLRIPKERLELWFWMESDRLLRPVFRDVAGELRVIEEERLKRLESSPIGPALERFEERFWGTGHPYSWSSDGRPRDWEALTDPAELRRIFGLAYAPERLTATLVGDVDMERVRAWAELYFGRLAARPSASSPSGTRGAAGGATEPRRSRAADVAGATDGAGLRPAVPPAATPGESAPAAPFRSLDEPCGCRTQIELRYGAVPFAHPDAVVLDVLAGILNGRTGRLHRELVLERGIAFSAASRNAAWRQGGSFSLFAESQVGESRVEEPPERLRAALEEVIATLRTEGVGARELEKVKNQITTDAARQVQEPAPLMMRLLVSAGLGDWRRLLDWEQAALAVTPADIQRVLRQYFHPERRGIMILRRDAAPGRG